MTAPVPSDPAASARAPVAPRGAARASVPGGPAASPRAAAGGKMSRQAQAPQLPEPDGTSTSPQRSRERAAEGTPGPETAPPSSLLGQAAVRARVQTPAGASDNDSPPAGSTGMTYTIELPPTVTFTVPGEPKSKSRHRTGVRGGKIVHYKDEKTARAQDAVGVYYRQKRGPGKPDVISGFGVSMVFYVGARQRRDVDNFVKLILDGLTGFAWADDSQVTEIAAKIKHGDAAPRSEVTVYPTNDLPDWMRGTCLWCHKQFRTFNSWYGKEYCTRACYSAARQQKRLRSCGYCGQTYEAHESAKSQYCSRECASLGRTYDATCAHCGRVWRKPVSLRRGIRDYCNDECHSAYWRAHPSVSPRNYTCDVCGAPKSRKEYRRCNACKRAGRELPSQGGEVA